MSSLKNQARLGLRSTAIAAVVITLTLFLQVTILARFFLTPKEFGLMALVTIIITFAQFYADAGLSNALIQRRDATQDELSSIYWTTVATGALSCSGLVGLAPILASAFGEPALTVFVQVTAMKLLIDSFGGPFRNLLSRELRFNMIALQDAIIAVGMFAVAIVAAACGLGVWALVLSLLSGSILQAGWLVAIGLSDFRPRLHFAWRDLRGYIGFGLFQAGERTVNFLTARLDQILLGRLAGVEALGFYSISIQLTHMALGRINPIVTAVAFPLLSKIQGDIERVRNAYIDMLEVLTAINAPILLGLCAVASLAVPMIFGANWEPAVLTVQLLAGVGFLKATGNPVGAMLLSQGRADLGFYWNVGVLVITSPLIAFGAYRYGAEGAAVALLIQAFADTIIGYYILIKPIIGSCGWAYYGAVIRPTCVAGVMASAVYLVGSLLVHWNPLLRLLVEISLGAALYPILLSLIFPAIVRRMVDFIPAFPGHDVLSRFLERRMDGTWM